jgi:hypothetical protein
MLRWAITHIVDPFRVPLPPVQLVAEPIGDNLIGPEIRNPDLEEEAEELALALLHDWRNPNEQDNYFPPIEENLNELIPQQPNHIQELIPEQPNNDVPLEDLLRLALDDRNLHLIHRYVKHILNLINKRSDTYVHFKGVNIATNLSVVWDDMWQLIKKQHMVVVE